MQPLKPTPCDCMRDTPIIQYVTSAHAADTQSTSSLSPPRMFVDIHNPSPAAQAHFQEWFRSVVAREERISPQPQPRNIFETFTNLVPATQAPIAAEDAAASGTSTAEVATQSSLSPPPPKRRKTFHVIMEADSTTPETIIIDD